MYMGIVTGTVVADRKQEGLEGSKLLLVQPLDEDRQPMGPKQVAVDTVRAGMGDFVLLAGSREASLALERPFVAVDAAVIGIIDDFHRAGERKP